ncbi:hypothetical protein YC2023_078153 [Brassica napus]
MMSAKATANRTSSREVSEHHYQQHSSPSFRRPSSNQEDRPATQLDRHGRPFGARALVIPPRGQPLRNKVTPHLPHTEGPNGDHISQHSRHDQHYRAAEQHPGEQRHSRENPPRHDSRLQWRVRHLDTSSLPSNADLPPPPLQDEEHPPWNETLRPSQAQRVPSPARHPIVQATSRPVNIPRRTPARRRPGSSPRFFAGAGSTHRLISRSQAQSNRQGFPFASPIQPRAPTRHTFEYWQRDKFWDLVSRFLILCLEMLETSALGLGQDLGLLLVLEGAMTNSTYVSQFVVISNKLNGKKYCFESSRRICFEKMLVRMTVWSSKKLFLSRKEILSKNESSGVCAVSRG